MHWRKITLIERVFLVCLGLPVCACLLLSLMRFALRFNSTERWSSGLCAGLPIEEFRVQIPAMAETWIEIYAPSAPLANSSMMSTQTVHCKWEDETVRERTGHPPSYTEAKKMKSLILYTLGFPRNS